MTVTPPVAVGLVGAGTWAQRMHAPTLAAGPETRLAAVWSRRAEAAEELGARYGVPAARTYDELLDRCAAVAFAVPPDIQADLAVRAAQAGRAVLLEKPLALDLAGAQRLVDAVAAAGVVSQVVFTKRYHPHTRAFLAAAGGFPTVGARACYLHGGFVDGPFGHGWRLSHGALYDLGPHVLDLLDAAIGPIATVRAATAADTAGAGGTVGAAGTAGWTELTCTHQSGAVSQVSLSGSVRLPRVRTEIDLFGPDGVLHYDTASMDHDECWPEVRAEFAAAVRTGVPPELDAARGLSIQRLLDQAHRSLVEAPVSAARTGNTRVGSTSTRT